MANRMFGRRCRTGTFDSGSNEDTGRIPQSNRRSLIMSEGCPMKLGQSDKSPATTQREDFGHLTLNVPFQRISLDEAPTMIRKSPGSMRSFMSAVHMVSISGVMASRIFVDAPLRSATR